MYKGDTTVSTLLHVSMYSVVMSCGLMSCSMGNVQRTHSVHETVCDHHY